MIKLPQPTDENGALYIAEDVYVKCISSFEAEALKNRLGKLANKVKKADEENSRFAHECSLKSSKKWCSKHKHIQRYLSKNYNEHMARQGSKGRSIYDQIIKQPLHRECPYCEVGRVTTLDHLLPKESYPLLAVAPNNLVPCCRDCQSEKSRFVPSEVDHQVLHPYFDPIDQQWIRAEFKQEGRMFEYSVSCPDSWSEGQKLAAGTHFKRFGLAKRFSEEAADRYAEVKSEWRRMFLVGGSAMLKAHLLEQNEVLERDRLKLWLRAMYKAASESTWLCEVAFTLAESEQ